MTTTMIQQEAFASSGTLDSGTPGGLGTVTGSFQKRPVGPRLTADATRGWSAIAGQCGSGKWTIPASANEADATYQYFLETWVYVDSFNWDTNESTRWIKLLDFRYVGNGGSQWQVGIEANDQKLILTTNDGFTTNIASDVVMPTRQWVQVRLAFQMRAGGYYQYDVQIWMRALGGQWVKAIDFPNNQAFVSNFDAYVENVGNGGTAYFRGRIGMAGLYKTTAGQADCILDTPGIVAPDGLPTTWHIAAGGSDANDGQDTAWLTPTKLDDELNSEGSILSGDTVQIDGVVWDNRGITVNSWLPNVTFNFRNNPPVFTTDISAPATTWTLESGKSHVWSTTNGSATDIAGCVVTENDILLQKLALNDYADAAALLTAMETTAGTSWEDGTKIYIHPLDGTAPSVNLHTFLRTKALKDRDDNAGASAILDHAGSTVDGGGLLFDMIGDASSEDGTGMQTFLTRLAYTAGTYTFRNARVRGWTKHACPCLSNVSDAAFITQSITDFGGLPFGGVGAATNLVDYAGQDGITNCSSTYTNVYVVGVALTPITGGTYITHNSFQVYYTHQGGTGSDTGFASVAFNNCNFPAAPLTIQQPIVAASITRSRMAAPTVNDSIPVTYHGIRPVIVDGETVAYVPVANPSGLGVGLDLSL